MASYSEAEVPRAASLTLHITDFHRDDVTILRGSDNSLTERFSPADAPTSVLHGVIPNSRRLSDDVLAPDKVSKLLLPY